MEQMQSFFKSLFFEDDIYSCAFAMKRMEKNNIDSTIEYSDYLRLNIEVALTSFTLMWTSILS